MTKHIKNTHERPHSKTNQLEGLSFLVIQHKTLHNFFSHGVTSLEAVWL